MSGQGLMWYAVGLSAGQAGTVPEGAPLWFLILMVVLNGGAIVAALWLIVAILRVR